MNIDLMLKKEEKKMKRSIKSYLSCIIIVVICIACATVFYVHASDVFDKDEGKKDTDTGTDLVIDTSVSSDEISSAVTEKSGCILSEYTSAYSLRCEWASYKKENEDKTYLSCELYLDSPDTVTKAGAGSLIVNGQKIEFEPRTLVGKTNLLCSTAQAITGDSEINITIEATLSLDINEESGVSLTELTLFGDVISGEKYTNMEKSHLIELEHISQFPDLPSGDEITSLCMVLKYLGYNADKCELSDLYLDKGPVGYTDFNVANVGNPKDAYNSYGCLPPVIVNSATKFISTNGGNFKAYDYSKKNLDELYYEVSQDKPVIVWACEDFDITPSISRIWIVDGKTLYLKSNMACMVLIGYDYENKTVTLANPAGNIFEIDMELFEYRYLQMGAYSVVIK